MKTIFYGGAAILILSGAIFLLQGLRVLPSALMYGKPEWVVIGTLMVVAGVALSAFVRLRNARK